MFELVAVVWTDAHSISDGWLWLDTAHDDNPLNVTTVGFLLPRGQGGKKGHLSIAQSMTDHRAVDSILHVPKGMVVKVTKLARGRFQNGRFVVIP